MFRKFFAVVSLTIACVPFARAQGQSLSPGQVSLVRETCAQVLGLKPGETYFARCRESLSEVFPVGRETGPAVIATADTDEAAKNFYEVSPGMRWNRERHACAKLGLVPGSTSFHQCAADLDGAFLPSPD